MSSLPFASKKLGWCVAGRFDMKKNDEQRLDLPTSTRHYRPRSYYSMSDSFVAQLEKGGYFKGLPPEKEGALRQDFEKNGWNALFGELDRMYFADAEDLAEGGVGEFLRSVQPFLAAQGVVLPDIEDDANENGYALQVGGVTYQIYSAKEMRLDFSGHRRGLVGIEWSACLQGRGRIVGKSRLGGAGIWSQRRERSLRIFSDA
jgi:hypothetical protein